jgi:hypothetical protein
LFKIYLDICKQRDYAIPVLDELLKSEEASMEHFICHSHQRLNCEECIKEFEQTEYGRMTNEAKAALEDFLATLEKRRPNS